MTDQKITKITKDLLELRKTKRNALDRRETQEKHLQKLSDREYKYNKEQWESLQQCIKHQQKKRLDLTCDLIVIKNLLEGIRKLQKGNLYDWYA